mmetsp:Transcript_2177/g.5032  ORF Transcript_2177/g.5032 Transcript_2177/m.5032 type:complete len:209 (+) Transcript_2177:51-677(+)
MPQAEDGGFPSSPTMVTSCTAGYFRLIRFWTSTLTAMLFNGGPIILSTTLSFSSPSWKISMEPLLTLRKGRMPFSTSSTPAVVSGSCSGVTATTSSTSGIRSLSVFSMPIFMVVEDAEQLLQAPISSNFTSGPSMSTILQSPPSLFRYGRSSSSTSWTLSQVKDSFGFSVLLSVSGSFFASTSSTFVSSPKGETTVERTAVIPLRRRG